MSSNMFMYFFLQSKINEWINVFWWKHCRIFIHIVSFNGIQTVEGQNYIFCVLQTAINDTRTMNKGLI